MLSSPVLLFRNMSAVVFLKSIIITASAIVISVSVTQFNVDELRWSLVILVAFVLLALLASVMAVFPKFKIHPEPGDQLPPGFSPFFLGHFSQIPKARYVELMADILRVPRLRAFAASAILDAYVDRVCDRDPFRKAVADQLAHFRAADAERAEAPAKVPAASR